MFPEGTRSKGRDFLPPKAGVGMLALRAKCPIVPAYVYGTNDLKGCLTGKKRMQVVYGPSMLPNEFADLPQSKESYVKIAADVMDRIGQLRDGVLKHRQV